jgi:Uma2 family endonuclease
MSASLKVPSPMTVAEFLSWQQPPDTLWQLVDGEPTAMAPASRTHAAIQAELGALLRNHLLARKSACSVLANPGVVPRVQAERNFRIPDLAVSCSDYQSEEHAISDPVLIVEILSASNRAETWSNVWTYTTLPSVREILVVHSFEIGADLLRRDGEGNWPEKPLVIPAEGELVLESIGFRCPLADLYRTTRLRPR